MKTKVLVLTNYYVPGVKGGGPIRSIKNMVEHLSNYIDFYIITSDRDLGSNEPYLNIEVEKWLKVDKANVFYIDPSKLNAKKLLNIITDINCDVLYLNSFFSYKFSILPILLRKLTFIPNKKTILAPRGEFSEGALNLKKRKKKFFLSTVKMLNLYKGIIWHATSETEFYDIQKIFPNDVNIKIANNFTVNYKEIDFEKKIEKNKNELKIAFISRIHPKKNLKKAIEFLNKTNGKVIFNIYGPIEDQTYWLKCLKEIERLPNNVKVYYKGILDNDKVIETFKMHHIFLFPTLGENFGHVISEALIGGCPVIVSDQTPWRDLEKYEAGKNISLKNEKEFISTIQEYIEMEKEEYQKKSYNAFKLGIEMSYKNNNVDNIVNYLELFNA